MKLKEAISVAIDTVASITARRGDVGVGDVQMIVGLCISGPKDSWEKMVIEWVGDTLQKSRDAGIDVEADNYTLAHIALPCGESMIVKTIDDMPRETIPCPCGDPGHYLVMYADTGGEEP